MKPHHPNSAPHQQPPRGYGTGSPMPHQGPPRGGNHHEYRPKTQAPPRDGPPDSPQMMGGQQHGMDINAPVFHPSGGSFGGGHAPGRGYNGPVFTPGQGLGPAPMVAPGQPGMPQQMRGPPVPHHHHQPQRMRGPPRNPMHNQQQQPYYRGMSPPPGPQQYYPPQMQQMPPPPYMMNQPFMGGPPQMGYVPVPPMSMGMPYPMAVPAPAPSPAQTQAAPRQKKIMEIRDPKTGELLFGASKDEAKSSPPAAEAKTDANAETAPTEQAPTPKTEKAPEPAPSPKKEAPAPTPAAATAKPAPTSDAKQNGAPKSPKKSPKKKAPAAPKEEPAPAPVSTPSAAPSTNGKSVTATKEADSEDNASKSTPAKPVQKSPKKTEKKDVITSPTTEAPQSPKLSPAKTAEKKSDAAISATKQARTISPKKKSPTAEPVEAESAETVASVEVTTSETRVESKSKAAETTTTPSEKKPRDEVVTTTAKSTTDVGAVIDKNGKVTYTVTFLMSLREQYTELPAAVQGPESKWPSMEVVNEGPVRSGSRGGRGGGGGGGGGSGGGGGGGGNWERGERQLSRQSSRGSNASGGGGSQWQRSQELPKRGRGERGGRGGRGGRGAPDPPLFDGPVKPLTRSENRWIPVKSASNLEVAKKKVQSVMNKMTREKFERLADQLTNIHMESLEILKAVITIIFDKALGEPHFCDMYADLCVHLDKNWRVWSFLKIVQNDDDKMFYWTTMSEADSEVVGPFESPSDALESANGDEFEPTPALPGMQLSEVRVQNQKFIKIWTSESGEGSPSQYYWSGQHLDDLGDDQVLNGPFESHEMASRYAIKSCSFKRILLNACQEEFEKDNIYEELEANFKKSKEKGEITPEMEADYEEKRIIMKGRMLGNIRFIGELYRKGMLQERIMHECIMKLMGVTVKGTELAQAHPGEAPDEENIESLCKLLSTMGKDLERHGQSGAGAMASYFNYMASKLLKDKRLSSRINFMIRDVIELRQNRWEPRRKELKAKTLNEARKEAEREQRAPPTSAPSGSGGGGGRSDRDNFRGDSRRSNSSRDGNFSRSTMAPVYQSHSMNSRSGGSNRMTLPIDRSRGFQRDESVKTGPQGRPASFGNASRRGQPAPSSLPTRRGQAADADAKTAKKADEAAKRPSVPPLSEDAKEKIGKKARSIAEEYVSIVDIAEADACLGELLKEFNNHADVGRCFAADVLTSAIEAKAEAREKMVELLVKLSLEKNSLSFDGVRHGLEKTIEISGDLWCDVPMLHEHVADIAVLYMKDSARTGVTLDWLMSGSNGQLDAEVLEELIDGGFLAAMCGSALKRLAAVDIEKAKKEVRSTYITPLAVLPAHQRSAKELKKWSAKYNLDEVLALELAFELTERIEAASSFNEVVEWIEKHIPQNKRVDSVFVIHACLFILSLSKAGELPSSERCMLLTGFCGNADFQARLVSAIIQTQTETEEVKKLLRHLAKEGSVLPPAFGKWLELKDDNSVGRKKAVEDLGRFVEELARSK